MGWKKIIFISTVLAGLMAAYLYGTRYQMAIMNRVTIVRIDRLTGKAWYIQWPWSQGEFFKLISEAPSAEEFLRGDSDVSDPLGLLGKKKPESKVEGESHKDIFDKVAEEEKLKE